MQLSKHFTLEELEKSQTATRKNINNKAGSGEIKNLTDLCYEVLEPVRAKFDKPIIIGSGKGKYELYDKAIPSFIKKYTKKWNAQVYDTEINTREIFVSNKTDQFETIPVTIIKLTDDMKQSVQQDGQALFSIFGIGAGAKIASDSMQNNIISEQTN